MGSTLEGFYNYYSTRYLIWANEAAKETLGSDFSGEGPAISPCFLMNLLFEQCGWEGSEYMQLTTDVMEQTTLAHSLGYYHDNGKLNDTPPAPVMDMVNKMKIAQYYRKSHPEW